jgi:hypothetical protein
MNNENENELKQFQKFDAFYNHHPPPQKKKKRLCEIPPVSKQKHRHCLKILKLQALVMRSGKIYSAQCCCMKL